MINKPVWTMVIFWDEFRNFERRRKSFFSVRLFTALGRGAEQSNFKFHKHLLNFIDFLTRLSISEIIKQVYANWTLPDAI